MEMQETKKRGDGVVPLGVAYNPHKAGLSSRNVDEVKRIVEEAARGGRFYENAEWKEAQLNRQIEKLCTCIAAAPKKSTAACAIVDEIESQRGGFDKVYVCVDFDAFYSAVAELDDPNLRGKPHAVGGGRNSVLSTSSYKARSFGVRSAMPLFVAKKLCPDLIG
jgi:DNA polymerase kappa